MGARDTRKVSKLSLQQQLWALDKMPSKKTKKAKAKERQIARKIIKEESED